MKYSRISVFWVETAVASIAAILAVVTVIWRDWIEGVWGIDPDRHSGAIEWRWVIAFWLAATLFAALARRDWRRASAAPSHGSEGW